MGMLLPWIVCIVHNMCRLRRIIGGQLSNAKCLSVLWAFSLGNLKVWGTAHHSEELAGRILFTLEQYHFWAV